MTSTIFQQTYVAQGQSLFTFINSLPIVFSFFLTYIDKYIYFFA